MKRDFTNENFERFLKQSADNLRMKASEKVWQNLSRELNKRRRRFVIRVGTFLLLTSALGYYTAINVSQEADVPLQQYNQQQNTSAKLRAEEKINVNTAVQSPEKRSAIIQEGAIVQKATLTSQNKVIDRKPIFKLTTPLQSAVSSDETNNLLVDQSFQQDNFTPPVIDSYTEFDEQDPMLKREIKQESVTANVTLPLTIESVINSFKLRKKTKLETQFYFTPTVSYRKLTENKSYLRTFDPSAIPANYPAFHSNVNNNVTHKPDIGFELGFTTKYSVSKKLRLRSGLQFNVNRYNIKAFSSPLSIATIALNNGGGIDSFNTISGYSNVNGYKSNWLKNFSFQVSAPVGVELLLSGTEKDKLQFGIAGTIQPTYVLGDRAYLITTDYKNYTEVPWLIRRWNVNTAFETFVMYNAGKTRWQVGPQVRYQLLSSFISEYPVKENLFDFGLKLGISINK